MACVRVDVFGLLLQTPVDHKVKGLCSSNVGGSRRHQGIAKIRECGMVRMKPLRKSESGRRIMAIDAAQEYDYEAIQLTEHRMKTKLKVGLIGFGNFGQFLAQRFVAKGHSVLAHSRSDYSAMAKEMGVSFFRDPDDFCEEHPEVVVLCTSILSTETVLTSLPIQRLKRSTLFVDVLSVKEFPRNLFLQVLPCEFDVLCTHPMFGPESGHASWTGLPFVFEKVRIGGGSRAARCEKFLDIFASEGCQMVEMTCKEHDRHAAGSQFITHTVGRVLGGLFLESTPINTKGYESLLKLVENTANDSFDLYYGLFLYNVNATQELQRLEQAFDTVKSQLFDQLHTILRMQLLDFKNSRTSGPKKYPVQESSPANVFLGSKRIGDSSSESPSIKIASNNDRSDLSTHAMELGITQISLDVSPENS